MNEKTTLPNWNRASRVGSIGLLAVVLPSLAAFGCHRAAPPMKSKVVEVVVTTPVADDITDYEDFTGRIDALRTVDIRPRVSGYVTEAPFAEGDLVKEGDLLFQIDPRTYRADHAQAEANIKQARAEVLLQTRRAERGRQLIQTSAIGPEDYEQIVAARDKAVANVSAMEAARDRAKLFLEFTRVTAPPLTDDEGKPLDGRVSRRLVDPGNLVNADQTILTTIVSVDPVYAYFDVDERTYLKLMDLTSSEKNSWFSTLRFPVLMKLANEEKFTQMGKVNFLDNRLNGNTGTVRMRGVFKNPKGVLKSGLFVRVRLPVGSPRRELLVPDEALQSDQGRKFVYVVKKGHDDQGNEVDRVEYRKVELGQSVRGLRVIKEGVKAGERIIVSGMQRVRQDTIVEVMQQEPPRPPESPLTKMLSQAPPAADPSKPSPPAPDLKDMRRVEPGRPGHQGNKGKR